MANFVGGLLSIVQSEVVMHSAAFEVSTTRGKSIFSESGRRAEMGDCAHIERRNQVCTYYGWVAGCMRQAQLGFSSRYNRS